MNLTNRIRAIAKRPLDMIGLEVHRKAVDAPRTAPPRSSMAGILRQARDAGLAPETIVDAGAAQGAFTRLALSLFPDAACVMIEPLTEYAPRLQELANVASKVHYVPAAATASSGDIIIHVHPDLFGSSVYLEAEDSNVNGVPRTVPGVTIDELVNARQLRAPYLLKADVQGAELDILRGALHTLQHTEYALLEVSCFEFFHGGPQFADVVAFMKSAGMVPYDLCGLQYRPLDNALSQVDIAFVREAGPLRQHHYYASREQREEQNRQMQSLLSRRGEVSAQ